MHQSEVNVSTKKGILVNVNGYLLALAQSWGVFVSLQMGGVFIRPNELKVFSWENLNERCASSFIYFGHCCYYYFL